MVHSLVPKIFSTNHIYVLWWIYSEKKISGCSYIEILKSFKNIITNENTNNLKIKIITSDFEKPLISAIKKVFKGIR